MADGTKIEWASTSWNPIVGCKPISPACHNCYAARMASRNLHTRYDGLAEKGKWTGKVGIFEDQLGVPTHWRKKARVVFVGSMADIFYDGFDDGIIDKILGVVGLCSVMENSGWPSHLFLLLTKRTSRARDYFSTTTTELRQRWASALRRTHRIKAELASRAAYHLERDKGVLPNLWLGATVENQPQAHMRVGPLLESNVAGHFLSMEPLLEEVSPQLAPDGSSCLICGDTGHQAFECHHRAGVTSTEPRADLLPAVEGGARIRWVIAGGESGPRARPTHPDWVRKLRDQCDQADVPFLFKQWGMWAPPDGWSDGDKRRKCSSTYLLPDGTQVRAGGGGGVVMFRTGKKGAGRELDGVVHHGVPDHPAFGGVS